MLKMILKLGRYFGKTALISIKFNNALERCKGKEIICWEFRTHVLLCMAVWGGFI